MKYNSVICPRLRTRPVSRGYEFVLIVLGLLLLSAHNIITQWRHFQRSIIHSIPNKYFQILTAIVLSAPKWQPPTTPLRPLRTPFFHHFPTPTTHSPPFALGNMGLSRQARIVTLLVIDTVFFLIVGIFRPLLLLPQPD